MEDAGQSDQMPMNETEDWVSVPHVATSETAGDVDVQLAVESPLSQSRANPAESQSSRANDLETTQDCAPASVAFSDTSSEQSTDNPADASTPEPVPAAVGDDVRGDEECKHVHAQEQMIPSPAVTREWSQAECHMNDIRYAEKATPCIPHRIQRQQLKILVTGQPETGRTTAIKNLFASIAEDPEWSPTDVAGLTMDNFRATPELFTTQVTGRSDTGGNLKISYIIQETPGIKGDPNAAAEVLANYMEAMQEEYAEQEANLNKPRGELKDGRVDAVLYFLPTNARIGESDLDFTVINALAQYAPVIPLMCKADCLEEEEILQRKAELERLQNDGLRVYSFPEDVVSRLTDAAHGLSRSDSSADELVSSPPSAPTFKPPFNIVAGTHADLTVHRFWFVRKYRWAECEAYRTSNSDLRLLRQLLLEDGFWCIKDEADSCYRALRKSRPAEAFAGVPAAANTGDQDTSAQLENSNGVTELESGEMGTSGTVDLPAGELRQSGRGSRFVPAWLHPQEPAPKATQATSSMYPLTAGAPSLREVVSTRGIGASARPASRNTTPRAPKPPTAPARRASMECNSQNFLSISSDDTEFNTLTGAAASALAMLTSDLKASQPDASPNSQPEPIANLLAAASTSQPVPTAPAVAVPAPICVEKPQVEEPEFDRSTCVEADVHDVQKGVSRNYRLSLKLAGTDKQLCLRIGETEGCSISTALKNSATSRPSAYDATAELLKALKCKVERILITECSNTIFYARVFAVNTTSGHHVNVDARPSDAINLALRHNAPVFVNNTVVKQFAK